MIWVTMVCLFFAQAEMKPGVIASNTKQKVSKSTKNVQGNNKEKVNGHPSRATSSESSYGETIKPENLEIPKFTDESQIQQYQQIQKAGGVGCAKCEEVKRRMGEVVKEKETLVVLFDRNKKAYSKYEAEDDDEALLKIRSNLQIVASQIESMDHEIYMLNARAQEHCRKC